MISQTYRCAKCNGPQEQQLVEVTTSQDAFPRYIPGRWEQCRMCGWTGQPIHVQPAPTMGLAPYGPAVPTPEDLLRALDPWSP